MRIIYVVLAGVVLGLALNINAQTAMLGSFNSDATTIQSAPPDSIVAVTAEAEGLSQVDPSTLPFFATCWWTVYPGSRPVPMPCPPQDLSVPIYEIADGVYLVDETGGAVSVSLPRTSALRTATTTSVASAVERQGNAIADLIEQVQETQLNQYFAAMFSLDVPSPGDGGSGGGSGGGTGGGLVRFMTAADYGTNLWVAQIAITNGYLVGFCSNTVTDVQYEIQSCTNLPQTDWQSEGFILGSETTNWTALPLLAVSHAKNYFIRLKSWADDGSGLPIWWQLQYFGYVGVDPYGNPAGDGWNNLQKFQNGMDPNQFYTPAAPSGLSVNFYPANNQANVLWQPAAGDIIGYQVEKTYEGHGANFDVIYSTNDFDESASTFSLDDDVSGQTSDEEWFLDVCNG